jgi:hypothetical protein
LVGESRPREKNNGDRGLAASLGRGGKSLELGEGWQLLEEVGATTLVGDKSTKGMEFLWRLHSLKNQRECGLHRAKGEMRDAIEGPNVALLSTPKVGDSKKLDMFWTAEYWVVNSQGKAG